MEAAIALLVGGVCVTIIVNMFLRRDKQREKAAYREKDLGEVLPNRLQAYERIALYLDRITIENMAIREQITVSTAKELHNAMVNSVRMEFEHNVAMQIYISEASWQRVLRAKQEVMKDLSETAKTTHPNATPLEYSAEVIEYARNNSKFYVERALSGLRKDIEGEFINK